MKCLKLLAIASFVSLQSETLSDLATRYKTDKGEEYHGYTEYYERHFELFREKPVRLLEIGFFHGASARMWREYFPRGELHFIDDEETCFSKEHREGLDFLCFFHVLDQSNASMLSLFLDEVKGEFDCIIDDGGHLPRQQITSFTLLFPRLKSGGIYVIEDLHAAYWTSHGGRGVKKQPLLGEDTVVQFLQSLASDLNYRGAYKGFANLKDLSKLTYYQRNIKEMHFYNSICFIVKR